MKTKMFFVFSILFMSFFMCFNSCTKPPIKAKKMLLKINFHQYGSPSYTSPAPIFNPISISDFILESDYSDWTIATMKAMEKGNIPGLKVYVFKDGSTFRENKDLQCVDGNLYIEVPETGNFEIAVDYLSVCRSCTGQGLKHEWWDNRKESATYTQTSNTININLDWISPSSLKACGQ